LKPRFLMPGGGQGPERLGYSHEPLRRLQPDTDETKDRIAAATDLRDEPEAPSPAWVNAEAELAARRDAERREHRAALARVIRANLSLENRIADCCRRAKLRRVDISGEVWLIAKMTQRGNVTTAEMRVVGMESMLDGLEP
jgi:hypothetical protein